MPSDSPAAEAPLDSDADLAKVRLIRRKPSDHITITVLITRAKGLPGIIKVGPVSSPRDHPVRDPRSMLADSLIIVSRGEKAAAAMESQLTALERKIDDLLASVDEQGRSPSAKPPSSEASSSNGGQDAKA